HARPFLATPPSGVHHLHASRAWSSPGAPCGGGAVAGTAGQVPRQPSALERFEDKARPRQAQRPPYVLRTKEQRRPWSARPSMPADREILVARKREFAHDDLLTHARHSWLAARR